MSTLKHFNGMPVTDSNVISNATLIANNPRMGARPNLQMANFLADRQPNRYSNFSYLVPQNNTPLSEEAIDVLGKNGYTRASTMLDANNTRWINKNTGESITGRLPVSQDVFDTMMRKDIVAAAAKEDETDMRFTPPPDTSDIAHAMYEEDNRVIPKQVAKKAARIAKGITTPFPNGNDKDKDKNKYDWLNQLIPLLAAGGLGYMLSRH